MNLENIEIAPASTDDVGTFNLNFERWDGSQFD
jgi:hypothetical protein